MKFTYRPLLFFTFMSFFQIQTQAQDLRCYADEGKALITLGELPIQVLNLLGASKTGTAGISDIEGKFNPGDVIIDATVPMRRLVSGFISERCVWLVVEYGGFGHYQKTLVYQRTENAWHEVAGASIERTPVHRFLVHIEVHLT